MKKLINTRFLNRSTNREKQETNKDASKERYHALLQLKTTYISSLNKI